MATKSNFLNSIFLIVALSIPLSLGTSNINYTHYDSQEDHVDQQPKRPKITKSISQYQKNLLALAKKLNIVNDLPPGTMQGIIWQESKAGGHFKDVDKVETQRHAIFFGAAQVSLVAAQDVLNRWPQLREQFNISSKYDIKEQLILNDVFNLTIAGKYLTLMKSYGFSTLNELALAYNRGPEGAKRYDPETHPYATSVANHAEFLKQID